MSCPLMVPNWSLEVSSDSSDLSASFNSAARTTVLWSGSSSVKPATRVLENQPTLRSSMAIDPGR